MKIILLGTFCYQKELDKCLFDKKFFFTEMILKDYLCYYVAPKKKRVIEKKSTLTFFKYDVYVLVYD